MPPTRWPVEQFMQRYYRTAMDVSLLNEMLLQLFREAILSDPNVAPTPVNPRFQIRNRVRGSHGR
jgi:[protein-PII] uridylyltransferase